MEQTKGLSCQIPESLHARVTAERIAANQSLGEYMTELLTAYYNNGGNKTMAQTRTLAFQIDKELFQRIKAHLARESARTGKKLTQRDFVLGLIEEALQQSELQAEEAAETAEDTSTEADSAESEPA